MTLRETLYQALLVYILAEVDQLAEEVTDVSQDVRVYGDDENGYDPCTSTSVVYRVPPEINRRGYLLWTTYDTTIIDLIDRIDSWKKEQG